MALRDGRVLLEGPLGGAIDPGASLWTIEPGLVDTRLTTLWLHLCKDTSALLARHAACCAKQLDTQIDTLDLRTQW